jgi:acyl carrier protein phosphodiesterase
VPQQKSDKPGLNHLAHILLAGSQADAQLGGMLGDFWRGAPDPHWRPGVTRGVLLHRKIDVYTDSHPLVVAARGLFAAPLRRYAGILLDVYFDHLLARDWTQFSDESLPALSERTLDLLTLNAEWLPANLTRFAGYMRREGLFTSYARRETIEHVLGGISRRLSRPNPLATAGSALWQLDTVLSGTFAAFFADLRGFAIKTRRTLGIEHDASSGSPH